MVVSVGLVGLVGLVGSPIDGGECKVSLDCFFETVFGSSIEIKYYQVMRFAEI